jgi:hypothetical protein
LHGSDAGDIDTPAGSEPLDHGSGGLESPDAGALHNGVEPHAASDPQSLHESTGSFDVDAAVLDPRMMGLFRTLEWLHDLAVGEHDTLEEHQEVGWSSVGSGANERGSYWADDEGSD